MTWRHGFHKPLYSDEVTPLPSLATHHHPIGSILVLSSTFCPKAPKFTIHQRSPHHQAHHLTCFCSATGPNDVLLKVNRPQWAHQYETYRFWYPLPSMKLVNRPLEPLSTPCFLSLLMRDAFSRTFSC